MKINRRCLWSLVQFLAVPQQFVFVWPGIEYLPRCSVQHLDFGQAFRTCLKQHNRVINILSDECWDCCRDSFTDTNGKSLIGSSPVTHTDRAPPVLAAVFLRYCQTWHWNSMDFQRNCLIMFDFPTMCPADAAASKASLLNWMLI